MNKFLNRIAGFFALLIGVLLPASLQAQDIVDITRLVFDVTPVTEDRLTISDPLSEADENNEEYAGLLNSISLYEDEINRVQLASNTPYDYELLEQYQSLGDSYQALGRHEDALLHYDNALQILKIQNGLYDLDQLPIAEKVIQSHIALGDMDNTTRWQEYIYYLNRQNFEAGSPEMVRANNDLADWYISSFFMQNFQSPERGLSMMMNVLPEKQRIVNVGMEDERLWASEGMNISRESPDTMMDPQMQAIFSGEIKDLTPRDVEDLRLLQVGRMYEEVQQDIFDSEEPSLDSIAQVARRIAGLSYITKQEMDYEKNNFTYNSAYNNSRIEEFRNSQQRLDHSYESGRNALRFIINLMQRVEANPRSIAAAMIELGDWNLAYGKIQGAQNEYQAAYEQLGIAGLSVAQIDTALNLAIPRQIPRSATHMYTRRSAGLALDARLDYRGYIDVSYEIDSLGNPTEIRFADNEFPESAQIESIITNFLKSVKYRPHFNNGELIPQGNVNLRYYYSY